MTSIREHSRRVLSQWNISIPNTLPEIDEHLVRDEDEVIKRTLSLEAVLAAAFGLDKMKASSWVEQNNFFDSLSVIEIGFLEGQVSDEKVKLRVEALYTLAWALGLYEDFDLNRLCPDNLATILPDIRTGETAKDFKKKVHLRDETQIRQLADIIYCLDWAYTNAVVQKQTPPLPLKEYIVRERRRAVDWLLGEDWESEIGIT